MPTAPREHLRFATVLRQRRRASGLTQQELAARSGVSARAISDLERAINLRPQRETAAMLAEGLGLLGAAREAFLKAARRPLGEQQTALLPPLPKPTKPLLGREHELRAIETILADDEVRVLTLTGPGGVGKTSLAIVAANRLASRFHDGVALVRLEGLSQPDQVVPAIVSALHIRETGTSLDVIERLAAYLAGHDVLLVLDNLEHLLDSARDLATLITLTPTAKLLVTSREAPRIAGERVLRVEPLPLPDLPADRFPIDARLPGTDAASVQLFVRSALDRNSILALDPKTPDGHANLASISEICKRLDGLPLAIELAAAQTEVLSPSAILTLLKEAGLPILEGGNRDQPARLQTMDAAIGWSYARLSGDAQALFRSLAVFAGGFTLLAAERVANAGAYLQNPGDCAKDWLQMTSVPSPAFVRTLTSLVRQNLVVQDTTAPDVPAPRFRMLEPLRLFALDRLRASGEEALVRRRHADYFAAAAELLDALTLGPDPEIWFEAQARELDNVRSAQDWALAAGEYGLVAHLVAYFAQFWLLRGLHAEGRRRVESAIAVDADVAPDDRWFLRFWAAIFAFDEGDVASARVFATDLLQIAEAHDDQLGIGAGLTLLSQVAGAAPEGREEAVSLARRAGELLEPLGQDLWTASAWARLGIEYQHVGRLEEARDAFVRGLALRRRSHCEGCTPYSLVLIGAVNAELGQAREAAEAYGECLTLAIKHGNRPLTIRSLFGLADLAWRIGKGHDTAPTALRFFGAAEAMRRRHGIVWDPAGAELVARWTRAIGHELGSDAAGAVIEQGSALTEFDVLEEANQLGAELGARNGEMRREGPSLLAALGSIE